MEEGMPAMDRGALALIVDESGKGKLTHLPDPAPDDTRRIRKMEAVLGPDGTAQLEIKTDTSGALAAEERQRYHAKGTRRERVGRDLAGEFSGFELGQGAASLEMNDLEDIEEPVKIHAKGKGANLGRRDGTDVSIPVGPATRLVSTFASLSSRKQDIRLHVRSTLDDELVIHLPPSMKVKSLPEAMQGDTPFGAFSISAEAAQGKVVLKTRISIRTTRIKPADYAGWRAFCEAADRAFGQRLVVGGGK